MIRVMTVMTVISEISEIAFAIAVVFAAMFELIFLVDQDAFKSRCKLCPSSLVLHHSLDKFDTSIVNAKNLLI